MRRITGHGIDVVDVTAFEQRLEQPSFRQRCFTEAELSAANASPDAAIYLAGRFAAKEALLKALGTGWRDGLSWRDIEVSSSPSGAPLLAITGGVLAAANEQGVTAFLASISHTLSLVVASVVMGIDGQVCAEE